MALPAADLDAMLKATGSPVVFSDVVTDPVVYGKKRETDASELDPSGFTAGDGEITLLLREGTQPVPFKDGAELTVGGLPYRLRRVGSLRPDGLRQFAIVERG